MNKITFTDKVDTQINPDPEINKVTASTLNEIKTIVNETVDQVEVNLSDIGQTVKITGDQSIAGIKTFTDNVIAITQANATNDTTVATTAFVKNLIGEIPAGLSFEGTWDADTNTPDLSTATLSNGKFWIVSVSGATDLGGITDWKVGDWAIYVTDGAGADGWQKVDNSSVLDGQGTGQTVALWSGSGDTNTLTNSPITVSGDDVTFAGSVTVQGATLNLPNSSYQITGGSVIGDLRFVAPRYRFYEDTISGTPVLQLDGGNATFAGTTTVQGTGDSSFVGNVGIGTDSPYSRLNLEGAKNTSIITLGSTTNNSSWSVGDKYGAIDFYSGDASGAGSGIKASISYEVEAGSTDSTNSMVFRSAGTSAGTNNTERMRIASDGAATFASSVSATNYKVSALNTAPTTATSTGTTGEIRYTADYIYVCTATDTWKRTALTTW